MCRTGPIADDGLAAASYHHDHDEELGMYWYHPLPKSGSVAASIKAVLDSLPLRLRDTAYWSETGSLVREYLMLQAGAAYSDALRQGFVTWLQRSPGERRQYINGDDMRRAALVDWYLKTVR